MKINSIKLTIADVKTSDKKEIAAVLGTVFIDEGKYKEDINGPVLDENGEKTPIYETINFTTAVDHIPGLKSMLQQMIIEALTLKNMEIAKENGTLSHFVQSVGGLQDQVEKKPAKKKTPAKKKKKTTKVSKAKK